MDREVVYVLMHEYELQNCDETKLLGIFTERKLAEEAQAYFETQPGFRDQLQGFDISETVLNRRLWSEGFVTSTYPLEKS